MSQINRKVTGREDNKYQLKLYSHNLKKKKPKNKTTEHWKLERIKKEMKMSPVCELSITKVTKKRNQTQLWCNILGYRL